MMRKFLLINVLFCLLMASCSNSVWHEVPYYISDKKIVMQEDEDICRYAEAVFEFYNNTDKEIESVEIVFFFFDDQNRPGMFNYKIKTQVPCPVEARHAKAIKVSLDPYIGPDVKDQYKLGLSYLSRINYSDGSVWNDQWGVYGIA